MCLFVSLLVIRESSAEVAREPTAGRWEVRGLEDLGFRVSLSHCVTSPVTESLYLSISVFYLKMGAWNMWVLRPLQV